MMSILIGCVGVLELLACLRHVADGVVITINQPATPCLSYHEQATDNRSTTHDSICSFSHSIDANLPRDAKRKLENLHEYSLRVRTELRSLDDTFDYNALPVCSGRDFAALSPARTPDSRFSPDFDYLCQRAIDARQEEEAGGERNRSGNEGTCHEDDNWRAESSSRDRPLSVLVPEKYVRAPTPIPRNDEDDDELEDGDEASSSGASSDVGTSFDNDSGNEAPTMRSFDSILESSSRYEAASSVDESDYNVEERRRRRRRGGEEEEEEEGSIEAASSIERSRKRAIEIESSTGGRVGSQRKRTIKSSSTITRKPTRLRSKNAEVSKSADNLTARTKSSSKRHREPERRKSDIPVRATRDEWTNTSPPRHGPGRNVSVQVQTSFENEQEEEEEEEVAAGGGAGSLEASKELEESGTIVGRWGSSRYLASRGRRSLFKNRRFGSRDKADAAGHFSMTNATPSVQERPKDEARLLKISSFEEADEEDYERIKNILSDSESEKRRRGKGYKSLSSFEDEEYWDAEDVSAGPIQYSIPDRNKAFWVNDAYRKGEKLLPSLSGYAR